MHQLLRVPARSGLAEAIRYTRARWDALCLFFDDGRIELDINTAERAIRAITLCRKNHLWRRLANVRLVAREGHINVEWQASREGCSSLRRPKVSTEHALGNVSGLLIRCLRKYSYVEIVPEQN